MASSLEATPIGVDVSCKGEMLHPQGQQGVHPQVGVSHARAKLLSDSSTFISNFYLIVCKWSPPT